jgi:phage terminase small subunit
MPARKPAGLRNRAETKAETAARIANEAALEPERGLSVQAPARLRDHPVAKAAWRRLMRTYGELQATVVTRMDLDLLVDYCILMEQLQELDRMRQVAYQLWLELGKRHDKVKQESADYAEQEEPIEAEAKEEEAIRLATKVVNAFDAVVKLDGRVDRKRDLLLKLRQSLYLTPRARSAAVPAKKEKPQAPDPLEALLDNVTDYVNGNDG